MSPSNQKQPSKKESKKQTVGPTGANRLPSNKVVVDTNVPKNANRATNLEGIPQSELNCVLNCVQAIANIIRNGGLVVDSANEIWDEYRRNLSLRGQPGIGDRFVKWVHDHQFEFPDGDRVEIRDSSGELLAFPEHPQLKNFDPSDKKFVAVSFLHSGRPPILQALDSKWWNWRIGLKENGVDVLFLCPELAPPISI